MKKPLRIPIRLKILITLLFVMTFVVSVITFIMANLFHSDKGTYIHDLTSVIAIHTSKEAKSLLDSYKERLQVFTKIMHDRELSQEKKADLLKELFFDFQDFVAVTLYENDLQPVTIYDSKILEEAGLSKDDLLVFREENPLPMAKIESGMVYVENSTISNKLLSLTLAIALTDSQDETSAVAAAVINLEKILDMATRSKVFETFLLDSNGVLLSHTDPDKVVQRISVDWIPNLKELQEQQSLGTTLEYTLDHREMVGGFARLNFGGLLAGTQIPKTAAYLTARDLLNNLIVAALLLMVLSTLLSFFWSRKITKPIELLFNATKKLGKGDFKIHVEATSSDEIGDLAESFNQMASQLDEREEALKEAHSALVHSEKMAAFGQLGAGIAHEVKNPLAGILGFAQLSLRKVEKESPVYKNLTIIEKESKRCKNIIENLMKFARQEKVSYEQIGINAIVEDAIAIVDHQLALNNVKINKDLLPQLPPVNGNANQIQQVLMNLMINAQQAMKGETGLVSMTTHDLDGKGVEIRVSDNGQGIPQEIQGKLFEPFFTTKPVGQGTGLGLSVSYGIIKDHKGDIRVESELGKGTTFIISLPAAILDNQNQSSPTEEVA